MPYDRLTVRRTLALLVVAVVAAACGGGGAAPGAQTGPLLPRDRLELPEYDPATFQRLLEELRGTPVVVNVWGSWCPPCEAEAPDLADVSKEFEGRVQFVGVDILDTRPAAREFIQRYDWPYPSVFDPQARIRDALGYVGQPVTIVYGPDGRKVFEWNGAIGAEMLRREIRAVL